jgi:hypothetical protein
MNNGKHFSDEFLNAFVDNQLAPEEKSLGYVEISRDETMNRQVCELRKLHDVVQLAYREPPAPPARPARAARRTGLRSAIAASLLLAVGVGIGLKIVPPGHDNPPAAKSAARVPAPARTIARVAQPTRSDAASRPAGTDLSSSAAQPFAAAAVPAGPASSRREVTGGTTNKVLIHVANDDTQRLAQALDDIEDLLRFYKNGHQNAHVEVVVNGRGMELVRSDVSVFAERIQRLQREYDNLTFAACQNTIDRLAREQKITVRLLPGVVTIDSGMAEIMRRQNQGWTYLQV